MPSENVEVIRRALEAFERGGVEAAVQHFDRRFVWIGPPEWLEDRVYEGHHGLRRLAGDWAEKFDGYSLEAERYVEGRGRVVALVQQSGRIKGSGLPVAQQAGLVFTVGKGKVIRVEAYFSWEEGLEAVGLSGPDERN